MTLENRIKHEFQNLQKKKKLSKLNYLNLFLKKLRIKWM